FCMCFFRYRSVSALYFLSLHDALPIFRVRCRSPWQEGVAEDWQLTHPHPGGVMGGVGDRRGRADDADLADAAGPERPGLGVLLRSEEHTSELQSRFDLVCRLLLANNNT